LVLKGPEFRRFLISKWRSGVSCIRVRHQQLSLVHNGLDIRQLPTNTEQYSGMELNRPKYSRNQLSLCVHNGMDIRPRLIATGQYIGMDLSRPKFNRKLLSMVNTGLIIRLLPTNTGQ
jgi:hypothetical protein